MFLALLWAMSAPVLAESADPQTPDPIEVPDETQAPEQPDDPKPLSQYDKALIQSAYDGSLADVEILVGKGAVVDSRDMKKRTPLILAASNGHTAVVELLFSAGADINARDSSGQTALIFASRRSFNETAAFLLENGADVNVQSKKRGMTALMLAAGWGNVELVQRLLEHGADASLTDIFGKTARSLAQEMGNSDVVDLLPDPPAQVGKQ